MNRNRRDIHVRFPGVPRQRGDEPEKAARRSTSDPSEQECRLFTAICDIPRAVLDELDLADYDKLQGGYRRFFEPDDSM